MNRKALWFSVVFSLSLAAGCTTTPPKKAAAPASDPGALTVVAEIALEKGDCRAAAESYVQAAAASPDPGLSKRASQVALSCEHLPALWQAASRWRTLAPDDSEAQAMYAAVALKLYRIPDARAAIGDFWKIQLQGQAKASEPHGAEAPVAPQKNDKKNDSGAGASPSTPAPSAGAQDDSGDDESAASHSGSGKGRLFHKGTSPEIALTELLALLLEQSDAPAVLAAMNGAIDLGTAPSSLLPLLGELALDAFDAQRAEHYAQEALGRDPKSFAAMSVLARAYVIRGDAPKAIATAREAAQDDPVAGTFEVADILTALERFEDAHQELERLRSTNASPPEIDRRLALLAFEAGDMKEAEQRFSELAANSDPNDAAMLYLADIDARGGNQDAALAGYRRLYDSSVALTARSRAATLLLDKSTTNRTEALALLDDYAADHPESEFELTLTKARLLADHGEPDTGLALLGAALERHPRHPSIQYDRAVILEQAGRVKDSVETLEQLLAERPDDPTLLNALGYTLADHSLELSRAEILIHRALTTMPDNPAALDSLGWVRFRQGDTKGAIPMLERAYNIGHDSEIAAHWGEALWVNGQHQQARAVWAAALAREPDSAALKSTLGRYISDAK